MRTALMTVLLASLAAAPCRGADDPRIRSVDDAADAVIRIAGREGFQSSIVFHDDERIENVAVGDSLGWQVTPNKRGNLLFLKPMPHSSATNLTVVTDKRVYLFDLELAAKAAAPLYSLRFVRKEPPAAEPPPPAVPASAPADTGAPPPPQALPVARRGDDELRLRAAELNFAWRQEGARRLLPAHVFDDGRSVYLDWQRDVPLPAILSTGPDGAEGPVNFVMRGNTIVVDGPVQRLLLRVGQETAVLTRRDETGATRGDTRGTAAATDPALTAGS